MLMLSTSQPDLTANLVLTRTQRGARRLVAHAGLAAGIDTVLLLATLLAVLVVTNVDRMPEGVSGFLSLRITVKNVALLTLLLAAWPAIFRVCGVYQRHLMASSRLEAYRVTLACAIACWLTLLFAATGYFRAMNVLFFWLSATAVLLGSRIIRQLLMRIWRHAPRRVIIVGNGPRGQAMYEELVGSGLDAVDVLGFVDTPDRLPATSAATPILGTTDQLEALIMRQPIDEVFITLPVGSHYHEIRQTIEVCERAGVSAKYRADIVDSQLAWAAYDDNLEGTPVVTMHMTADDSRLLLKRLIDIVGGGMAILAFAPLMIIVAVLIKATSRGPILFAQQRYGFHKRVFWMYKFRTMVENAHDLQDVLEQQNEMDGPVFKIRNDPRMTPFGRFLRRTSLDELPQLFHVVAGQMSLVGPRPLPLRDVARITRPSDMRRFSVRPGLTCLWQISGRNNLEFNDWIRLDLTYIDFWSLLLDLRILIRTIPAVFRGVGAS